MFAEQMRNVWFCTFIYSMAELSKLTSSRHTADACVRADILENGL